MCDYFAKFNLELTRNLHKIRNVRTIRYEKIANANLQLD